MPLATLSRRALLRMAGAAAAAAAFAPGCGDAETLDPAPGLATRIADEARRGGVLVRPIGNKIVLSPPLTLTSEEAGLIVRALDHGLATCR